MLSGNYHVNESEYGLNFDEEFDATNFLINFEVEPENAVSASGWVHFEPRKRLATLYYYGHPEDLSPSIREYDLHGSELGHKVLVSFNEYKIGDLYRTATAFTIHVVEAYEADLERIWNEYKERA